MLQAQAHKWVLTLLGKIANSEKQILEETFAQSFTHYAQKLVAEEQEGKNYFYKVMKNGV